MVAEASCILGHVHAAAADQGVMFPLSRVLRGTCTFSGNLAINADGIQVLRQGNARKLCLGQGILRAIKWGLDPKGGRPPGSLLERADRLADRRRLSPPSRKPRRFGRGPDC